ncbi:MULTISPECIES: hypothetical protein [unclassified Streptomyces]|uniref:hypothetical protein n=1 Tax=unclassified Streptomyces TaxID=2593676 RepID=UPI0020B65318|nr:hypothetical protein [Streptomyces sp. AC558_RSS880]
MATDTWQHARTAVVDLWRRAFPQRADTIEAELVGVREEIQSARQAGDDSTEQELAEDWQRRLMRLLRQDPGLGEELQRILDDVLRPSLSASDEERVRSLVMNATASGSSRVYQAARDIHVTES